MIFGIPMEHRRKGIDERRVGLSPAGVRELVDMGAQVFVERGAGEAAGFRDEDYKSAGAQIVYSKEEAYKRADVVLKVGVPRGEEWNYLRDEQAIFGYLHLAVAPKELLKRLVEKKVITLGYEIIQKEDGTLPVLKPMSQIAGRMSVQIAGRLLESKGKCGRGVLLGGIAGIPPADVVILGGGVLGYCAAQSFAGVGASVYIVDKDMDKLELIERTIKGRVITLRYTKRTVEKLVRFADVLVGAILVPGARTPIIVTEEMVKSMKRGAIIIDFSIDQGGCVETIRLTPTEDYVYEKHGVIHFAVPNVPSWVARTATHALTNAILPYLRVVVEKGLDGALKEMVDLKKGVYTYRGNLTNRNLILEGYEFRPIDELLED